MKLNEIRNVLARAQSMLMTLQECVPEELFDQVGTEIELIESAIKAIDGEMNPERN